MSGIAGIYYLDGRSVGTEIDRMVEALEHRGPDEQDTWTDGPVGLGHCMLHTTPESHHASLPQENTQSGCVVTADARIDNRDGLIKNLQLPVEPNQAIPDSTLILRAYEKWGRDCTDHILGAFCFSIWDPREKRLFCTKDHFGIRPLYYYYDEDHLFAFASEIKALFQIRSVPQGFNQVRIAEYLRAPIEEDVTRTFYEGIRRMPPAHTLDVQLDSATSNRYWALDPHQEITLSSDEAYAERFRAIFEDAVRARLRSDRPVGSMLSGGLDSSSIACQAAQILEGEGSPLSLHTFSAVFDEFSESDESKYINAVLDKYSERLSPHVLQVDERSPLDEWDELYRFFDGACPWGNIYIQWRLFRVAQDQGVRVILDGFDGDTTVSHGLGYFNQLREEGRWIKLVREVAAYAQANGESPRGAVWSWIKSPLFSLPGLAQLVEARQFAKEYFGDRSGEPRESSEPVWRRALSKTLLHDISPHIEKNESSKPPTQREHQYQSIVRPVMTHILDGHSYITPSSAVTLRYPFYDKRLVEFCLALPPEQKLRRGWSRLILRNGMQGVLPSAIQWREGKGHLNHGFDRGLRRHERPLLTRLMESKLGGIDRFVSSDFLREEVPEYLKGRIGTGEEGEGLVVWRALTLALWLQYLEGR